MAERAITERYELLEPLGSGATGKMWRANDRSIDRACAVKVIKANLLEHDDVRERVESHLRRSSSLTHANIAAVYDWGRDDGSIWVAGELVEGVSLASYMDLGPIPVARSARIGRQILAALDHAHAHGVVHGSLTPTDVLIAGDDEAKVADFGLAIALAGTEGFERPGSYLAPEVHDGKTPTPLSDVYSVGCILFECLAGHRPYGADNPAALAHEHRTEPVPRIRDARADVGEGYESILMKAMAKYPADRFPSAKHMDAAIEGLSLDHDQDTPPAVVTHRSHERERTRDRAADLVTGIDPDRTMLWVILGVITALLIGLIAVLAVTRGEQAEPTPVPTPIVTPAPAPVLVPVPQPPVVVEQQPQPTPIVITPAPTQPEPEPEPAPAEPNGTQ